MNHDEVGYFRRREWQERAAAKNAASLLARRVHQQMAEHYAAILRDLASFDPVPALRVCGAL